MKRFVLAAGVAAALAFAGAANALTLKLDGYTAGIASVTVNASPVAGTPGTVGATGFNVTDTSGDMGSFVAWCLDISHFLMKKGASQTYNVTDNPFSNSFGLSSVARNRVQSIFDANYGSIDFSVTNQAAAFQMALWEAAFEDDATAMGRNTGLFRLSGSSAINTLASGYLTAALNYTGGKLWNMKFLEVEGGMDRAQNSGQNLVTVSAVPVPAAGLLLLTALAGAAAIRRRRTA